MPGLGAGRSPFHSAPGTTPAVQILADPSPSFDLSFPSCTVGGGWGCIGGIRWSPRLSPSSSRSVTFYTVLGRNVCSEETFHRVSVAGMGEGLGVGWGGASLALLQPLSGQSPAQLLGPGQSLPLWPQSPCWHSGGWTGWSHQPFECPSLHSLKKPLQMHLGPSHALRPGPCPAPAPTPPPTLAHWGLSWLASSTLIGPPGSPQSKQGVSDAGQQETCHVPGIFQRKGKGRPEGPHGSSRV